MKNWRLLGLLMVVQAWIGIGSAVAQPNGLDFHPWQIAGPDRVMDRLFGAPSAEEEALLAKVEISGREERQYGEQLVNNYVATMKQRGVDMLDRGAEVDYLKELVAKIQPRMKRAKRYPRIRVLVAITQETDAYSFPGGTLVFTSGLIDFCESEAALLGVVGHELSHLDHGHQLVPLRRSKLAQSTLRGQQGMNFNDMMQQMQIVTRGWTRPFEPEDEIEADRDAAGWLLALGYEPRELVHLMVDWQRKNPIKATQMPAFLRSHPYTEDRVEAIEAVRAEFLREHPDEVLKVEPKFIPLRRRDR